MATVRSFLWAVFLPALVMVAAGAGMSRADGDQTLLAWMTGSFGSGAQAAADSAYFDIRLQMVRVWPDHADGFWL